MKKKLLSVMLAVLIAVSSWAMPVEAAGFGQDSGIMPLFDHTNAVSLTIDFDSSNVAYCKLTVDLCDTGSGVSGIMKLYNSAGTMLKAWSVSDYDGLVMAENTYQGKKGETYTVVFQGYTYSNNTTAPDRLDLSATKTCEG